jgi:hypothetical protein
MSRRAPKSRWSAQELDVLKYLLVIYGYRELNYKRAARLFENRTAAEIKKRCVCIRDFERRKQRRALEQQVQNEEVWLQSLATTATTTADAKQLLPPEGRLHPDVVWVPATAWDIGFLNL